MSVWSVVEDALRVYHDQLDAACWSALERGCGVLVEWGRDPLTWTITVTTDVPPYEVHEVRNEISGGR